MGAWGTGVFDNDTAADFVYSVIEDGGVAALVQALDRVLSDGAHLDAPDAEEGLAAAEIIARLNGKPGHGTADTAELDDWVKDSKAALTSDLLEKARRSITRILTEPSELLDLWRESEAFDAWRLAVESMTARLS